MERFSRSIEEWLWPAELPEALPKRALITIARYSVALTREFASGELTLRAMSLVYTTMLSIVPLLALSFSILKGLDFHHEMEPILQNLLQPLGPRSQELTDTIISFVDNVEGSALAGISLIFLLYTLMSMAQKVENSFNYVWRVDRPRSLGRRFSEYLSVMLIGPVLMSVSMTIVASVENAAFLERLQRLEPIGSLVVGAIQLAPYLIVVGGFSFLYAFVPNVRVRARSALLGGLFAGFFWVFSGAAFAQFVASTNTAIVIYSGFAIVIFGMIWLYVSWLVLLLGAQFAFFHQNPEYLRVRRRTPELSNEVTERLAMSVMLIVGRTDDDAPDGWSLLGLAHLIGVPRHVLAPTVNALRRAQLLVETTDGQLLPARDLRKIAVAEILAAVRTPTGEADGDRPRTWNTTVQTVAERVDDAVAAAVDSRTLADLVDDDAAARAQPRPA
ncbi:MAG TPA: YihY/virulence factor BrkB family protein [Gammaproteobacteria bacterium]